MTFFGEELGLVGSRYYGAHPVFPLAKTVADLNLEQLGRTDVDGGSSVGLVNVTGFDFLHAHRRGGKGRRRNRAASGQERAAQRALLRAERQPGAGRRRRARAHAFGGLRMFPDYHKPGDEWPKIDYANLALVDRTVAVAVFRVANSLDAPHPVEGHPRQSAALYQGAPGDAGIEEVVLVICPKEFEVRLPAGLAKFGWFSTL
jgi:hypothetical protein